MSGNTTTQRLNSKAIEEQLTRLRATLCHATVSRNLLVPNILQMQIEKHDSALKTIKTDLQTIVDNFDLVSKNMKISKAIVDIDHSPEVVDALKQQAKALTDIYYSMLSVFVRYTEQRSHVEKLQTLLQDAKEVVETIRLITNRLDTLLKKKTFTNADRIEGIAMMETMRAVLEKSRRIRATSEYPPRPACEVDELPPQV